jgi:hypothetical protein
MMSNQNQKAMVRGPIQNLRKQNGTARRGSATVPKGGKIEKIPPRLLPNPIRKAIRRYSTATSFSAQTWTQSTLYNQFLTVVAVSGNAISFADMVRIKRIKAWVFGMGSDLVIQPTNADVNNQFASPERTYTASCVSTAFPAVLVIKPNKVNDPLGGWKETNNVNFAEILLVLNFAASTTGGFLVLDFEYEYIENIVGGPNGYAVITSTTVLGTMGSVVPFAPLFIVGSNQL